MEIEPFYNRIKLQTEMSVINLSYIMLLDNTYQFYASNISLRENDKEDTLKHLNQIASKEGFYAFSNSDKGKKFINENQQTIKEGLYKTFFGFQGLGRVCKN